MGGPLQVCPECRNRSLHRKRQVPSGVTVPGNVGGWFELLPGLGTTFRYPTFDVIVCAQCGLTRFYADADACGRLSAAPDWELLSDSGSASG
jgi:predicted nucleic-acid-binding Zn-ribbon protein